MKEYWVDQERFYASLASEDMFELAKIITEIEDGIFYLVPKGFENDYSTLKVPTFIVVKLLDQDSLQNIMVAIDFKSNFTPSKLERCSEDKLRKLLHFFEKLLGFELTCFTQEHLEDPGRFFGILNTFLELDIKLLIANENVFSKLHTVDREGFEDITSMVKLTRAMRDFSVFLKEWNTNYDKKVFFKPSVSVSGFDIALSFNQTYYISKSSILPNDSDRKSLQFLLTTTFIRFVETLSRLFRANKKHRSEYEVIFPIELIKPENMARFVEFLRKISEKFEEFYHSDSGLTGYIERLSRVLNLHENKINQIKRYFNFATSEVDLYKLSALINGSVSKSTRVMFEKAYFEDFKTFNLILESFAEDVEKFFMEVSENV